MKLENLDHIASFDFDKREEDVLMTVFSIIDLAENSVSSCVVEIADDYSLHPFLIGFLTYYQDILSDILRIKYPDSFLETSKFSYCKFERNNPCIDSIETGFTLNLHKQIKGNGLDARLITVSSYLIGELVCNIQEHSLASTGYLFAFLDGNLNSLFICVADNGITIPGSYLENGRPFYQRLIAFDQAEALRYSTKGVSTKNRPENESRGYGISTNIDMVVNGLGGAFHIISGGALFSYNSQGEKLVNLPDNISFDGTFHFIRIPLNPSADFKVYDYIE